jgi:DNA-binding transcriptional MerR regulator
MTTELQTVSDIANRHHVTKNTVRNWCGEFAAYLSESATSTPRRFTETDRRVFGLVAEMRAANYGYSDIRAALANDAHLSILLTEESESVPAETDTETTTLKTAEVGTGQQALALFQDMISEVRQSYIGQVDRLETELTEERAARIAAERQAAANETEVRLLREELDRRRKSLIDRLLGR